MKQEKRNLRQVFKQWAWNGVGISSALLLYGPEKFRIGAAMSMALSGLTLAFASISSKDGGDGDVRASQKKPDRPDDGGIPPSLDPDLLKPGPDETPGSKRDIQSLVKKNTLTKVAL